MARATREVLDELGRAAARAYLASPGEGFTYQGEPVMGTWRLVAQAVRDADRPYRNPTPEAYAASNRACEFHRARAREAVATAQGMLGALITLAGDGHSAELSRLGATLARLEDDRVPREGP